MCFWRIAFFICVLIILLVISEHVKLQITDCSHFVDVDVDDFAFFF